MVADVNDGSVGRDPRAVVAGEVDNLCGATDIGRTCLTTVDGGNGDLGCAEVPAKQDLGEGPGQREGREERDAAKQDALFELCSEQAWIYLCAGIFLFTSLARFI